MAGTTPSGGSQAANLMSQVGGSALGSIVGEGMGLLFNETNDMNQNQEQKDLDTIQQQFNESTTAFNMDQQYQMWLKTNYPAQVQQMEKAGLNPALMYSGRGAGGATTGGMAGPSAPGATALPNAANGMAVASMQQMSTEANINLMNAQADKIKAETPGAPQVQQAEVTNLIANANNANAQAINATWEASINKTKAAVANATQDDAIGIIRSGFQEAAATAREAVLKNYIDQNTMNTQIQQAQADLIGTYLKNTNLQTQGNLMGAERDQVINNIQIAWKQLSLNQSNMMANRLQATSAQGQADAATMNASTNAAQLAWQKEMQNVPQNEKYLWDAVLRLIPSFSVGSHTTTLK